MNDKWRVVVEDGKYAVRQLEDGRLLADRYGDTWRDLTGDKLVCALAMELLEAKAELGKLREDEKW